MADLNQTGPEDDVFVREAQKKRSLIGDVLYWLKRNRKWWLVPLLLLIAALGIFLVLSSSGVAPFIYTVF